MTILVVADHDNDRLNPATFNTVTAARECGNDIHVLVAGKDAGAVASAASVISGVASVIHVEGEQFAHGLAESLAAQVARIAPAYTHVLFPATSNGKNVAPRVAALLGVAQLSEVTKVVDAETFERPIYAGNVIVTVQSLERMKVLTVRATSFDAAATEQNAAPVQKVPAEAEAGKATYIRSEVPESTRPELATAEIVVSGGRALGSEQKFQEVLAPLADKLGAAMGASRAAVDAGYATNDMQVGQTGKIVAPKLYFAIGISGAVQHLAGMKDSKCIVAINKDPEAPIFGVADYCLEADLFEAVPELTRQLENAAG